MKSYSLNDRVIAITGATGGLGRAAVQALRDKGAKLVLLDLDLDSLNAMAAALGGPDVAAGWVANVRSIESLETALKEAARHFGGIDVVVAGAGVSSVVALEYIDPATFDRVIDINLNGVARTFRAALPHVKARQGYLLAISSMAAFVHSPLNTAYTASKAGVWALCDSLRLELRQHGVGVGSLHPTFFQTPMMEAVIDGPSSTLVWNNHQGIWQFVALEQVVAALVECIEQRHDLVTVPRSLGLVAKAPGLMRRLIEWIGFDARKVAEAVRLSDEGKT
ncbi:SDR family NAD(P)-dependent oxidoreductase [Pseudomonas chlororaphis]|uniref:SDR family NAD(P)-dependent oxidoreductase n=1 Tax=Pseudomonas chlororaphis TaxID=587753 RepID=UPI0006A58CD1|nr:SDR family NAD(P)-dependent oxidoreductase [Pseudomonas chlororaphis]AZD02905.1 Short-chain dehydrogenase/reductase SDR [Pseudomonas chlororaphis subsp. chlororaphis]MBM0286113.1 SDR family NAD(P)-dependent oxidoreductase [Pseudomonas chlororaphis]MDO1508681.1 SDR family NAD(P)-dependent oxidoreductase [Pseudomonas chlororaphis]ORM45649.1 short-chain dehydrogenase [Pseudomonas chlororaphis subsp. chlororaphis]TWR91925.1 SDR family NAD(P)-dependent oxidoreductase [Pseudomonas chlororaphis su